MTLVVVACLALVVLTTLLHYEALRLLSAALPQLRVVPRARLIAVILGTFAAHALEIALYAAVIYALVHGVGAGTLGAADAPAWTTALYFSAETYTSLGYGDVVPQGALRALAGVEALNGLLLIGWTASYTYVAMQHFWGDGADAPQSGAAR
jgi:voltage-gated potassium channel Kch